MNLRYFGPKRWTRNAPVRRFALVLAMVPALLAQQTPRGTVVQGELGTALDAAVSTAAPAFWGAVAVGSGGTLALAKGYGLADRAKIRNGPLVLFDCGALAHQITAIAALRLAADGKLALDRPVAEHLPGWPSDKAAITLRHLLAHTSGLPPEVAWNPGAAAAARTAIAAIGAVPLLHAPGTATRFSHVNASLLALVVEHASGTKFEKAVARLVFAPAGTTGSAFAGDRGIDEKNVTHRLVAGETKGVPANRFETNWAHRGARGMLMSALDLHALAGALVDGKLLDAASLEALWSPVAGDGSYAVVKKDVGGTSLLSLHGATAGYSCRVLLHRPTRTIAAVLGDEKAPLDVLEGAIVLVLAAHIAAGGLEEAPVPGAGDAPAAAPAEPGRPAATSTQVDAVTAERFCGTFLLPTGGTFTVARENGGLVLSGSGLQASARVVHGRWPPGNLEALLRTAEDSGLARLQALRDGDADALARGFASADAAAAAAETWKKLSAAGAPGAAAYVGTSTGERPAAWFRVVFGEKPVLLRAPLAGDRRWLALTETTETPPFRAPLRVERADWATATVPSGARLTVSIEGRGTNRRLVYEDATDGAAGLIECPLVH